MTTYRQETRAINDIVIGERSRRDMGDIVGLAANIAEIGLLQPIALRSDGVLIAGERRLRAAVSLGWTTIPVHVVDLEEVIRGEFAENVHRKDFSPSELVAIGQEVERIERERARWRKAHGGRPGNSPERQCRNKYTFMDLTPQHAMASIRLKRLVLTAFSGGLWAKIANRTELLRK